MLGNTGGRIDNDDRGPNALRDRFRSMVLAIPRWLCYTICQSCTYWPVLRLLWRFLDLVEVARSRSFKFVLCMFGVVAFVAINARESVMLLQVS